MKNHYKLLLILVTAVSAISDSILIPFYPQYFSDIFGVDNASYVGLYLAIYCLVVMLAFPVWAKIAKHISVLPLLVITQSVAACLSTACYWAEDLSWFWVVSLLMMVCKASYLLVYPFLLSCETPEKHGSTIGILVVAMEFCAIFGALLGGILLHWFDPRQAFLMMAVGDVLQVVVCLGLITVGLKPPKVEQSPVRVVSNTRALLHLGVVKILFFFSAFLGYHFFTQYWSRVTEQNHALLSASVFAIPAAVALLGLAYNHYRAGELRLSSIYGNAMLAAVGALLQAIPHPLCILLGRLIFGWTLFQIFVRLDVFIFQLSHPSQYAQDYSLMRIAQSSGVLLAVYASGYIVSYWGAMWMFIGSALGLCMALGSLYLLFGREPSANCHSIPSC